MRTKEEIIEAYLYEIEEKFEWSLHNEHFNCDDIEKILKEMYEEIKPDNEEDEYFTNSFGVRMKRSKK
ncbi:MAG: hypothetical protein H8E55_47125 [Pelagibacterales bacterium]|nr:hypothetical protein [Pelagibacterales bacterium]